MYRVDGQLTTISCFFVFRSDVDFCCDVVETGAGGGDDGGGENLTGYRKHGMKRHNERLPLGSLSEDVIVLMYLMARNDME